MFNSLLYCLSLLLLFICILYIKKSSEKLNIIKWCCLSLVCIFCINALVAYCLSYLSIPYNLLVVSFIYLLLSILIYFIFIKKGKQNYYFEKKDLLLLFIVLFVVIFIAIFRFGFPFSIRYESLDAGVHYQTAYSFYKKSLLLNFVSDGTIYNFQTWRFGSYVNLGLIFKVVSPLVSDINLYNVYILYDLFTLFFTGIIFYYLIQNFKSSKKKQFAYIIGTVLFLLGYPLNNLLFGFFYVGHASIIFMAIILLINDVQDEKILFGSLFIMNIGILFTYYLFAPIVFVPQFCYFIKHKNLFIKYIIIFVIPLILWYIYFILPTFCNNDMNLINQIGLDGYFYSDIFSNFILFFPIITYYFCNKKFNKKEMDYCSLLFIFLIFFIIIILCWNLLGIIKMYYVSKYFYILWIMCFLIFFKAIDEFYEKNKMIFRNYIVFMLFTIILSISNIENNIINSSTIKENKTTPVKIFGVYKYNIDLFIDGTCPFSNRELHDIKKYYKLFGNDFLSNTEPDRVIWLINFIQPTKVDCPANNLYNCINDMYYLDPNKFIELHDDKLYYLFFSRSIYWKDPRKKFQFIEEIDNGNYDIIPTTFGYIIKEV